MLSVALTADDQSVGFMSQAIQTAPASRSFPNRSSHSSKARLLEDTPQNKA
jgi:hypothetical protein